MPGNDLVIARAPLPGAENSEIHDLKIHARLLLWSIALSQGELNEIKFITSNDTQSKLLLEYCKNDVLIINQNYYH